MVRAVKLLIALAVLACAAPWSLPALAQEEDSAMLLVAHPAFRDVDYRQTVLFAAPGPSGGHVGVILNRPTRRSLASLFPEHEPSKKVIDPVYGARPLKRAIQSQIENPLAKAILEGRFAPRDKIRVDYRGSKMTFEKSPARAAA